MTDEQIINIWKHERELSECVCSCFVDQIELSLVNETIDLITRQQAEIERLKEDNFIKSQKRANIFEIVDAYERGKSEAVKEFVEKSKKVWWDNGYESPDVDFDDFVDNLVKEMVGDEE